MVGVPSGRAGIKLRLPLLLWRKTAAARPLAVVDTGWPCRSTVACTTHLHALLSCCERHATVASAAIYAGSPPVLPAAGVSPGM